MDVLIVGLCVLAFVAIGVSWWLGHRAAQKAKAERVEWFESLSPEAREEYLKYVAEQAEEARKDNERERGEPKWRDP